MNGLAARSPGFVAEDQATKSDSFFIWRVHDKRVVKDVSVGKRVAAMPSGLSDHSGSLTESGWC
jgi:hypothetical protein